MADSAVSLAVGKLAELALSEAALYVQVGHDMRRMRDKLEWLQSFLRDADQKRRAKESEYIGVWVRQTRDVAFLMEDSIDEFLHGVHRLQWGTEWWTFLLAYFPRCLRQMWIRHSLSFRITDISNQLNEITTQKNELKLPVESTQHQFWTSSDTTTLANWDELAAQMVDLEDVGAEGELRDGLLGEQGGGPGLHIVSLVGESGIGKTSLATKLYDSKEFTDHFEVRVWLTLRPKVRLADLLYQIRESVFEQIPDTHEAAEAAELQRVATPPPSSPPRSPTQASDRGGQSAPAPAPQNMQEENRAEKIGNQLRMSRLRVMRFLIVLDGVVTLAHGNTLRDSLPDGIGSRVLLIPHADSKDVAVLTDSTVELRLLGRDRAKELFYRRVLGDPTPCALLIPHADSKDDADLVDLTVDLRPMGPEDAKELFLRRVLGNPKANDCRGSRVMLIPQADSKDAAVLIDSAVNLQPLGPEEEKELFHRRGFGDLQANDGRGSRVLLIPHADSKDTAVLSDLTVELRPQGPQKAKDLFNRRVFGDSKANDCRGKRVLLIPQADSKKAAVLANPTVQLQLRPLGRECRPPNYQPSDHATLEWCEETIVDVTGGLPLAVVLLAGLLRSKEFPGEWCEVLQRLKVTEGRKRLTGLLSLCFDDLPHVLKACFLYFAVMPEQTQLDAARLVRLWTAEGLIRPRKGKSMEEIGQRHLKELISRCLIQLVDKDAHGGAETVAIHSRVHAFVQSEAHESGFVEIHDNADVFAPAAVRRLSLQNYNDQFVDLASHSFPKLRSISCDFLEKPDTDPIVDSSPPSAGVQGGLATGQRCSFLPCFSTAPRSAARRLRRPHSLVKLVDGSKFLRVIDLHGVWLEKLPHVVGSLIHLRYLGLRCTRLRALPRSVAELRKLQTLDVRESDVKEVVDKFWEIRELRHVLGKELRLPFSVGALALNRLQTLHGVKCSHWGPMPRGSSTPMEKMVNLRSLELSGIQECHLEALKRALEGQDLLVSLSLAGEALPLDLFTISGLRGLQSLKLNGKLVPEDGLKKSKNGATSSRFALPNLARLTLWRCDVREPEFIESLARLPSLAELRLWQGSFSGKELVLPAQGFGSLAKLELQHVDEVQKFRVESLAKLEQQHLEAMRGSQVERCAASKLASLSIRGCSKMETLQGLENLEQLKEVVLIAVPRELILKVRPTCQVKRLMKR